MKQKGSEKDVGFSKTYETLVRYGLIIELKENPLGSRPSWEEYGMALAIDAASRYSCKYVQAGTVFMGADTNLIRATGYNGVASRQKQNCLEAGCQKDALGLKFEESLNSGNCEGIHAEMNALRYLTNERKEGINVFNTIFPCHTCAKNIMPYNPQKIIFKGVYSTDEFESTVRYLKKNDVRIERLDLSPERFFDIATSRPPAKFGTWSPEERGRIKKYQEMMKASMIK